MANQGQVITNEYDIEYSSEISKELEQIKEGRSDKTMKFRKEKRLAFHKRIDRYTEAEGTRVLREAQLDDTVSITASRLLKKKRDRISDNFESVEIFSEMMEIALLAKAIDKEDSQLYIQDVMNEYTRQDGRKKTFSEIRLEFDDGVDKRIWEGKTGKAVLVGLFMRMRSKMTSAKNDGEKFKALADMIALSAMFNYENIQDVFKQLKNTAQ